MNDRTIFVKFEFPEITKTIPFLSLPKVPRAINLINPKHFDKIKWLSLSMPFNQAVSGQRVLQNKILFTHKKN